VFFALRPFEEISASATFTPLNHGTMKMWGNIYHQSLLLGEAHMKNFRSHIHDRNNLDAILWLTGEIKAGGSTVPASFESRAGPKKDFVPETLPVFINPRVKIGKDGEIENISEFKSWDDIFDFSRCLGCSALHYEYYGSSGESPCMKCHSLVKKIKEKNYKALQNIFYSETSLH
jgi:hypothetical protein